MKVLLLLPALLLASCASQVCVERPQAQLHGEIELGLEVEESEEQ